MTPTTRARAHTSIVVAACTLAIAYALLTIVQRIAFPGDESVTAPTPPRIAFFWRLLVALHLAVFALLGTIAAHRRFGARVRALHLPLVGATFAIAIAQATFFP